MLTSVKLIGTLASTGLVVKAHNNIMAVAFTKLLVVISLKKELKIGLSIRFYHKLNAYYCRRCSILEGFLKLLVIPEIVIAFRGYL
ncbi:MAG: hypothetical protein V7L21_08225 [Nostoc sp.]|uniref:hypothetical protein n=1 Tax=unclassified Nostoc TaxID=2593658 RepID=UPI0025EA46A6|nr:hypothetical protein [Nostoc sp. NMS9]MBN3938598.1 hypothetical protein [Nostoc sp. NMS9]